MKAVYTTRATIFSSNARGVMLPVAKLAFACTLCIALIPIPASGDDENYPFHPQSEPSKNIPLPDSDIHDKDALVIGNDTDENDDPVNESKKQNKEKDASLCKKFKKWMKKSKSNGREHGRKGCTGKEKDKL